MSVGRDPLGDSRFASLDAAGLVELCNSLADYGEAGGLSRELMLQVGGFGEARFDGDVEAQLAVARMYLLGGETDRAKNVLVRAGKVWPDESRVRPLLAHALRLLEDRRSVDEVLREPLPRQALMTPGSTPPPAIPTPPSRPAVRRQPDTLPMSEAARARAHAASRVESRGLRGFGSRATSEALAPTPASGMPIIRRAPGAALVRAPVDEPSTILPPAREPASTRAAAQVRTEVDRRAVPREAREPAPAPPSPALTEPRTPRAGSAPRRTRIRLLDPDDERRRLDPYELIGELASGGMATVFLARLAGAGGFQRFVAIKRLHAHIEREEQFVKMFLDEARLAAGIHHPHVVPILEVGTSDAGYYLVMEFIEGDTLAGLIVRSMERGAPIPPPIAARIVLDALAGLHAAHQLTDADGNYLGLVHRDCTPQNVLVGVDGSARITDFGVARAASRLATTRPQQVKGKLAYLSPEQAHASDPLDRRSDIFTMGIVLWEAIAGRPLFQASTAAATLERLLSGQVPSLQSHVPGVPEAVDEVCRRALAHDRSRRYRTAVEMAEALERAANAEGFGGVASPRELGRFVEALMGAEIAAQREAVRGWLSLSESTPLSRGPRSPTPNTAFGRSPSSPRSAPPRSGALPIAPRTASGPRSAPTPVPRSEDAPDTPPPRGEKVPRLSSVPPEAPAADRAEGRAPAEHASAEPRAAAPATAEDGPTIEVHEEPLDEAADEPLPAAPRAATVPARPWLARLVDARVSKRTGVLLVVVIVALALAPLAYRAAKQRARTARPPAGEVQSKPAPEAPPVAAPRVQPAD